MSFKEFSGLIILLKISIQATSSDFLSEHWECPFVAVTWTQTNKNQ